MVKRWWRTPVLRDGEKESRKATWLELFFDLVFVIAIFQLSHVLSDHLSLKAVLNFVILFLPTWWIWIGVTFYADRFDTDSVIDRLFTFLQILAVAVLALNIPHGVDTTATGFALAYIFSRVLLAGMWARAGYHNENARALSKRYVTGFCISIVLWTVSIFMPAPVKFVLWGLALAVDLLAPLVSVNLFKNMPSLDMVHLPERFGLFTIIVLGESIISVFIGASENGGFSFSVALLGFLGLAMAFCLWWLYFDHIMSRKIKEGIWWRVAWAYAHIPLLMSLTAIGAGILVTIKLGGTALTAEVIWLMCGSVAASLISMGALELTLAKKNNTPCKHTSGLLIRFGGGFAVLFFGYISQGFISAFLLGLLLAIILVQVIHGMYITHKEDVWHELSA